MNELTSIEYDRILEYLSLVVDPELGVNIVDLGLISDLALNGNILTIKMTLTYAGCPLTEAIREEIELTLKPFNHEVKIEWIWLPPWDQSKITNSGREQLIALGMNF